MKLTNRILGAVIVLVIAGVGSSSAFADDPIPQGPSRDPRGFRMGLCVGQALAKQGVTLPAHQPGQRPSWDVATKAAFKAAMQGCRSQFGGPPLTGVELKSGV